MTEKTTFKAFLKPLDSQRLKKRSNLKNNLLNSLKDTVTEQIPAIAPILPTLFPKKSPVIVYRLEDHVSLYAVANKPVLFETGDHIISPTLFIAMHYPGMLPAVYIDEGAVKAIFRGAFLMAAGVKEIPSQFPANQVVEIRLLGQSVPCALGVSQISSEELASQPKGQGILVLTFLRDSLYMASLNELAA